MAKQTGRLADVEVGPVRRSASGAAICLVLAGLAGLALTGAPAPAAAADDPPAHEVGLARVYAAPRSGAFGAAAPVTPEAFGRTPAMAALAAPTNQWFSSLLFGRWSEPIHAHPATYRAAEAGFEVGYPVQTVIDAGGRGKDIAFPHRAALTLQPTGFRAQDARLAGRGDFSVDIRIADAAGNALLATLVHGSPYSYYTLSSGDLRVHLATGAQPCAVPTDPQVLCVAALGRFFAVFAPADAHWLARDSADPTLSFGASGRFATVAVLPDGDAATLAEFQAHAYAFVTDTRVDWHYDPATSRVETRFSAQITAHAAGADTTLLGVYPHQERALVDPPTARRFGYESIRGPLRTVTGNSFRTAYTYHGILPFWGALEQPQDHEQLASVLSGDAAKSRNLFSSQIGHGTYWYGKALSAVAQLLCIAEQEGDTRMRDAQLKSLRERMETWFRGDSRASYFVQDARIGSVLGYPDEYGSVAHMNDHHFHYGYWLNAAAQVALRDPEWARRERWGAMVDLLAADIGTAERGRADFPFLRNFDAYEGHAWASGDASFVDGNNQESSSEAVNAWAGLILWGEATGNTALRDQGIWMYTTETEAIADYWFDERHVLFPPAFGKVVAAQVFGGRYAYNTWWTEEPRQIQGINLIPITPASVYLGRTPDYVRRFIAALGPEKRAYSARGMSDGTPDDVWQDLFAAYLALADPAAGMAQWKPRGTTELGETRSHTLYWLLSLKEMGPPDFQVTADTPLFGVFRTAAGVPTYLAYNAGNAARTVHFSDGHVLEVAARSLARGH